MGRWLGIPPGVLLGIVLGVLLGIVLEVLLGLLLAVLLGELLGAPVTKTVELATAARDWSTRRTTVGCSSLLVTSQRGGHKAC